MNINEIREQICGKEPVRADYPPHQSWEHVFWNKRDEWRIKDKTFNATAAAILELVKDGVPDKPKGRMMGEYSEGKRAVIEELLTTIENLKNELK